MPDAQRITAAIMHVETRGKCDSKGASGEDGCLQFMPSTWEAYSREVLGYVAPMTPINEQYVAGVKITQWLKNGHDYDNIARIWNQGNAGPCRRGVNKHGVKYDSCSYEQQVLAYLN